MSTPDTAQYSTGPTDTDPAVAGAVVRCSHDSHLIHLKGRYGTYADGRDAEPCTATNDWGQ